MAAVLDINSAGNGNFFTSPNAPSTHHAFVVIPLQEGVGISYFVDGTMAVFIAALFYSVLIAIILEGAGAVLLAYLAIKVVPCCQQLQYDLTGRYNTFALRLYYHVRFRRRYTGRRIKGPALDLYYAHAAGTRQAQIRIIAEGRN
jgi:hypothetical protein